MSTQSTDRLQSRSQAKWVRMSARKARLVLDNIRGRTVPEARTVLAFTPRAAAIDIERVMRGGLVTKAVYLEDPTKAEPVQSRADTPLELGDATEEAALKAAHDNGRLVAVVRLGDSRADPEELAKFAVLGTVLLPGETTLGVPAVMPYLPTYGVPLYDPAIGPKPATEECFVDGGDKGDPLGKWRDALVGGDAEAGRRVFVYKSEVSCLRCHKAGGQGAGEVGPDLTGIGAKQKREYLLESIVFPSKQIAKGYETVELRLVSGLSKSGILKSEDAKVVRLMTPEGALIEVKNADIEERTKGKSAMPEDLTKHRTRREVRDLVEFLASLKECGKK